MATYYWVGGSGTWNATDTTNWATTSGGAGGAGVPTSLDDVIFDSLSNATAYTVTVGTNAVCADLTADGPLVGNVTFSLGATARIDCHSSMTLAATGITWTGVSGCLVTFRATTTGKTVTTNGVSLVSTNITFDGVGGAWALGSALTATGLFTVTNGTLDSANYNITYTGISSSNSNIRSITLGSSTVTLTGSAVLTFTTSTNLTFNAGTSSIVCSGASTTFGGGGQTFYNVSFTSAANGTTTINGANTFNDLSQTSRSATGHRIINLGDNQTVSGTLTLGAANTAIRRIHIQSSVIGTQRTITLNGTLATLADVDFRDIGAAGTVSTPWTGTRLGNGLNNNNITFDAPKTVYWNLAGSASWTATGWATTNNGTPDVNNFPLAQDTATFTEAGSAGTVTIDANWYIGSIQMADGVSNRTTAFTLATTNLPSIYGNVTLFSSLTLTGTGVLFFNGQGTTQTITSAGVTFPYRIFIDCPNGTVQFLDTFNSSNTAGYSTTNASLRCAGGTLDINNQTINLAGSFGLPTATSTRVIAFGSTGKVVTTGNNITVLGYVGTNSTATGSKRIECAYSGSTGTRAITFGSVLEADVFDVFVTAGTDIFSITTASANVYGKIDFTGFTGTSTTSSTSVLSLYGDLVLNSSLTFSPLGSFVFRKSSGTQRITSAGKTFLGAQFGFTGLETATYELQDNLTISSATLTTLTSGTLDLNDLTLSTGFFNSTNSNTREIAFGTGQIDITGNNTTVWTTTTNTNLTVSGSRRVEATYSGAVGTRTLSGGGAATTTEANALDFFITAGTDIVAMTTVYRTIDFTGFAGTFNAGTRTIFGNLIYSSGMTLVAGTNTQTFASTSGTQQITTNGQTLDFPITIDGVGGTFQLQDNMTVAIGRVFTLTNGTLDIDGKVLSVGNFSSSNSNTRVIDFGTSGELTVAGVGTTAFNAGDSTGLSITGTGAKINMSGSTAKTFAGGGFVYPLTLVQSGLGNLTLTGANTFDDMVNTIQPCTIIFPASTTTSFKAFNVNGTEGSLVSLRSSSAGTRCVLAKV